MIRLKLSSYSLWTGRTVGGGAKYIEQGAGKRVDAYPAASSSRTVGYISFFFLFFRKPRQANASRSRGHGSSQIRYNYSCRKNGWIQSAPLSPPHFLFCTFSSLPTILFRCFSSNHRFFLTLCSLDPPRLFRVLITSYCVNSEGIFASGREFF